jgi:hypothetical protein
MRNALPLLAALSLMLCPAVARAQTPEIQQEIETRLWYLRLLAWVEATTGMPPAVAITAAIALIVAIVASVWLWLSRRREGATG